MTDKGSIKSSSGTAGAAQDFSNTTKLEAHKVPFRIRPDHVNVNDFLLFVMCFLLYLNASLPFSIVLKLLEYSLYGFKALLFISPFS